MDQIKEIIEKYPKHFSKMIKRDTTMYNWVMEHSLLDKNAEFPHHIFSSIHQQTNVCPSGNIKPYRSINDGFGFCDTTKNCKCCKDSVSQKVSKAKLSYSDEKKQSINSKRLNTTMTMHGVSNNGQTTTAKKAHIEFYQDLDKVSIVNARIKEQKLEKYGNQNYNNRELAKKTCIKKYKVPNAWLLSDDKQNPNLCYLKDKSLLEAVFPKFSVEEISKMYGVHTQTVYRYLGRHQLKDPFRSSFEKEIVSFLRSIGVTNILENKRTIIGKELDIYLPDYNLAIEYNGIYWHHDKIPHITKTYHYDKFIECEKIGITLLTIFADSWDSKKEIWKQKIKSKINLIDQRIYARNTKVVVLNSTQCRSFLNENHIQGYCSAQICLGLVFNDKVVAVMTFSKKRPGIGKDRGENAYELVRYATSAQVTGGASKLLSYFIKNFKTDLIYSYSDNQYSVGNLYVKLGFTLEQENKCGYRYYDPQTKKPYHRYNFTKHRLVAAGYPLDKTEKEIMDDRGFLRLWDCGTRTWILDLNNNSCSQF